MEYFTPGRVLILFNAIGLPLILWFWPEMNKDGRDGPWRGGPLKWWTLVVWGLWREQFRHFGWISYTMVAVVLIGFFLLPIMIVFVAASYAGLAALSLFDIL